MRRHTARAHSSGPLHFPRPAAERATPMRPEEAQYATFAKALHWLVACLLVLQFAIGWIMPSIRRGMQPGSAMHAHISTGIVVLGLIVVRFGWRLTHPVPPEPELPRWQRSASAGVHWLLYLLVFVTTLTGWFYASARGWSLTFFGLAPLPALVAQGSPTGRGIGAIHESIVWVLLTVIVVHVLAALTHAFVYRDRVMQRILFATRPDTNGRVPS
jgi:cytochrome b561